MTQVPEKLQKILANQGVASRRAVEIWIQQGRIRVNGTVAHLGQRVTAQDHIEVDGQTLILAPKPVEAELLLYYKPEGEMCTRFDPEGRPTVFDRLPLPKHGKWVQVGRLDCNTSGLLLFTTDGALAHRLMHPTHGYKRVYLVRTRGAVTEEEKQRLLAGIALNDGVAAFADIIEQGNPDKHNRWYQVTVHQGRNRIVRRLLESLGHEVSRLIRVQYGDYVLDKNLKPGDIQYVPTSPYGGR
jgi:23S rRNA pseudouridine2605 synthase